jgi:hypothetical protein
MAPGGQRGVGVRKRGTKRAVRGDGATCNRTLPTAMTVRNLGQSARVLGFQAVVDGGRTRLPSRRGKRESAQSPTAVMSLLSMAVVPEERRAFRRRFQRANKDGGDRGPANEMLGGRTPMGVVASAYGCQPFQLSSLADMFPESGMRSNFLNEFYVMDVILNRRAAPSTAVPKGGNDVCLTQSYDPEDEAPDRDYQFRAVILFLPQCGVFYCSRDCHAGDAGLPGTLRAYDMSWLRLHRSESERSLTSYTFGDDSFVKRLYSATRVPCGAGGGVAGGWRHQVSAWRISTGRVVIPGQQVRTVFRASQGLDKDLPVLPPDFFDGMDFRDVPSDYRAHEYRDRLKASSSAKEGCRHYVDGAHHYHLPESCWIVDPNVHHFVDIHITINGIPDRESVVMVRNIGKMDPLGGGQEQLLSRLTKRCTEIRLRGGKGNARSRSSDVGGMFAIGTKITMKKGDSADFPTVTMKKGDSADFPTVYKKVPYATNLSVGEDVIRGLVVDLADIGSLCFPQVYSVIRDTEVNSGLSPLTPMDGSPLADEGNDGDGDVDGDDTDDDGVDDGVDDDDDDDGDIDTVGCCDLFTTARAWADAQATLADVRLDFLRRKIRRLLALLECRRRVGYTVDMSVNLGNSSHFDVNDASQAYSAWMEEMQDWGENWCFVMPNVKGERPDGTKYHGLVIKLGHGIAISWDGRVVRHCTSVSCPDGMDAGYVGVGKDSPSFVNHLYGVFTCAKEKIVQAGRAGCAANYRPVLRPDPWREGTPHKKRLNRKRRHRRKERGPACVDESTRADKPDTEVVIAKEGTATNGHRVNVKQNAVPSRPTAADLEIGGAYTIPKRKRTGGVLGAAGCGS